MNTIQELTKEINMLEESIQQIGEEASKKKKRLFELEEKRCQIKRDMPKSLTVISPNHVSGDFKHCRFDGEAFGSMVKGVLVAEVSGPTVFIVRTTDNRDIYKALQIAHHIVDVYNEAMKG